jgi:hypothetical protein
MRRSLAGNFEALANAPAAAARLSEPELKTMLDMALKLAAENKITDRNVWSLPLIDFLPDMVQHAPAGDEASADAGGEPGGPTNYFTRISGGLDAGVTIYAKRVDATFKLVMTTLSQTAAGFTGGAEGARQAVGGWGARRAAGGWGPRASESGGVADWAAASLLQALLAWRTPPTIRIDRLC